MSGLSGLRGKRVEKCLTYSDPNESLVAVCVPRKFSEYPQIISTFELPCIDFQCTFYFYVFGIQILPNESDSFLETKSLHLVLCLLILCNQSVSLISS